MGWNQSRETHVSLNVILRLIGPPRGCPLKAMRFSLKRYHVWTLLPTNPTNSDPVIYELGSPSANYCVWKEPERGRKRNKAARLLQRKMSILTVSLHSSREGTRIRTNHLMTVIQQTMPRNVYNDHVKMGGGGGGWFKLIAHQLSVQCTKTSTVQLSLWEAVSQGQWMRPISSPPCYIWFNGERRGPQTELWERVQQQCGQVVNTQTWRGRAGLQTGLISPGLSRPADMKRRGKGEEAGERWFGLLLFTPLPSTTSLLPAALSFGLSGYNWRSGIERKHYNGARDRQTGRQMHLEAEVSENSWDPPIC